MLNILFKNRNLKMYLTFFELLYMLRLTKICTVWESEWFYLKAVMLFIMRWYR